MKAPLFLKYGVLAFALFELGCISSPQEAGIEIKNGNCVGTIYNTDNSAARGAAVQLISVNYDPAKPSSGSIDSTVTDTSGNYFFDVDTSAFYNIIARKGSTSCLAESVSVRRDAQTTADDTLETSGTLTGTILVRQGDNPRDAVLLIMGTSLYTAPNDSTGKFTGLSLPAGRFNVRAFSSGNGYGIFDTTVTIVSGTTTELTIRIPASFASEIRSFSVAWDSATQYATLRWVPGGDTSLLKSYAVHRSINGVEDTIIMVDRRALALVDDCIEFTGDTIGYAIAAVGTTFKEGYAATAPPVVVCGREGFATKKRLNNFSYGEGYRYVTIASGRNVFLSDERTVLKIGADGTALKSLSSNDMIRTTAYGKENIVSPPDSTPLLVADPVTKCKNTLSCSVSSVMADTLGHLYVYLTAYAGAELVQIIAKFDEALNHLADFTIPAQYVCATDAQTMRIAYSESIVVGSDGLVYLQSYCESTSPGSKIRVLDAELKLKAEYSVNCEIGIKKVTGNTIIALSPKYPDADVVDDKASLMAVKLFDRSFNLLSSYETINAYETFGRLISAGYRPATKIVMLSTDVYMTILDSDGWYENSDVSVSSRILVFSDRSGTLLGRLNMPGDIFRYSTELPDVLYGISQFDGPVMYEISLDKIVTAR